MSRNEPKYRIEEETFKCYNEESYSTELLLHEPIETFKFRQDFIISSFSGLIRGLGGGSIIFI